MEAIGINAIYLFMQLIFLIVLISFPVVTLFDLAKKKLSGAPLALRVFIICVIPLLGALAYWIIKPTVDNGKL